MQALASKEARVPPPAGAANADHKATVREGHKLVAEDAVGEHAGADAVEVAIDGNRHQALVPGEAFKEEKMPAVGSGDVAKFDGLGVPWTELNIEGGDKSNGDNLVDHVVEVGAVQVPDQAAIEGPTLFPDA